MEKRPGKAVLPWREASGAGWAQATSAARYAASGKTFLSSRWRGNVPRSICQEPRAKLTRGFRTSIYCGVEDEPLALSFRAKLPLPGFRGEVPLMNFSADNPLRRSSAGSLFQAFFRREAAEDFVDGLVCSLISWSSSGMSGSSLYIWNNLYNSELVSWECGWKCSRP